MYPDNCSLAAFNLILSQDTEFRLEQQLRRVQKGLNIALQGAEIKIVREPRNPTITRSSQ